MSKLSSVISVLLIALFLVISTFRNNDPLILKIISILAFLFSLYGLIAYFMEDKFL